MQIKKTLIVCFLFSVWQPAVALSEQSNERQTEAFLSAQLPGGDGSVDYQPVASYLMPLANLSETQKPAFYAAKALAHQPWVKAPASTTARDGLGPLYNARSCLACHINGGRGLMPTSSKQRLTQAVVRFSIEGNPGNAKRVPLAYGEQLQTQSVALAHQLNLPTAMYKQEPKPEANAYIDWHYQTVDYGDGTQVELRQPLLRLENLAYGDLPQETAVSLRNAPAIHGVGLLENIAESDILMNVRQQQLSGIVSGKVNRIWDPLTKTQVLGRFGWKANQPSILVQTAKAFQQDIGISNPIFADQPCTDKQMKCLKQPNGYAPKAKEPFEINTKLLNSVADFTRNLAVPKARPTDKTLWQQGQKLFAETGCVECHRPSYLTQNSQAYPQLAQQRIWPYTDMLLHDMGDGLADHRTDGLASGSEWRTPPLWGIGLSKAVNGSQNFLHDGRARNIEEAILWHGGEADVARQNFVELDKAMRQKLLAFIETL